MFIKSKSLSTIKTDGLTPGHIVSRFKKPESNYPLHDSPSSPEPSNIWVKRLRHDPLDSLPFASKRLKTRDESYIAQTRSLLGVILNHDVHSFYLSNSLQEQEFDGTPLLTRNGECSYEESKAMNYWIRRWCHRSHQAVPTRKVAAPAPLACKTSDGKQFPSIGAMALMGASAKKSRSCRYKRKGSLLLWHTEGL